MNFCGNCGTQREDTHRFCAECGISFHLDPLPRYPTYKNLPFIPSDHDIQIHQNHLAYYEDIAYIGKYIAVVLLIISFLSGYYFTQNLIDFKLPQYFSLIPSFVASMFIFICLINMNLHRTLARTFYKRNYIYAGWSLQDIYESFESAKLDNNEQRCIYCGHNRLYRKGVYAADSCSVFCTKCKAFLYYD